MRLLLAFWTLLAIAVAAGDPHPAYKYGFDLDIDEPTPQDGYERDLSKGLQEFTPITNTISEGQTQYYSFSVNTSTGLGEYYQFLIFIAGNICSQPENLQPGDPSLTVYYSFNSLMTTDILNLQMVHFENGYFQALADAPISEDKSKDSILYIAVRSPENTNRTALWLYEIGVSQNDLVFQWDDRTWALLVDADSLLALIVTGNLLTNSRGNTLHFNASRSQYLLFIYSEDYRHYFDQLNSSWCAVRNGPALLSTTDFVSGYTERTGGLQQQFWVHGLNKSSTYLAYLVANFRGTNFGGAVYHPLEFNTMDTDACQLIYDLDFCDQVAYAVPASPDLDYHGLCSLYDNRTLALYENFTKALDQIACDTTNDAVFLPVRTCEDCAQLYKDWLCSVSIPRCTTTNNTGLKYREVGESRNDFINSEVQPPLAYFEVLPCVNVCQAMVRDCPADFGFLCPTSNASISQSYYWDMGADYASCNFVGVPQIAALNGAAVLKMASWASWVVFAVVIYIGF